MLELGEGGGVDVCEDEGYALFMELVGGCFAGSMVSLVGGFLLQVRCLYVGLRVIVVVVLCLLTLYHWQLR